jgi:hypothetical protein
MLSVMIFIPSPPTFDRYVAEIRNLVWFRCRPFYIVGRPHGSVRQLRLALDGRKLSKNAFRMGDSTITVSKNGVHIY